MLVSILRNFSKDLNRKGHSIDDTFLMNIIKSPRPNDSAQGCCLLHGDNTIQSCNWTMLLSLTKWFQKTWKIYLIAHLIPIVLYKKHEVRQNPLKLIGKILLGFIKSHAFILANCVAMKLIFCKVVSKNKHPLNHWLQTLFFTSSIFFESSGRMEEIAIWVLPRFLELVWNYIKKRGILEKNVPGFLSVMFALSVGVFCELYNSNKAGVKSKYQTLGEKIIGDDVKTF